ncbi:hypothetical protein [Arcobacter nitrofigilis]|nr:hypothetical protein [Arcobacter nitrofigilis]
MLGLPFFTRCDDWSNHFHEKSVQMIKDGIDNKFQEWIMDNCSQLPK